MISKLNTTDRWFALVNRESWDVLAYAGVDVSKLCCAIYECTSISTLEFAWNNTRWGEKSTGSSLVLRASCYNEQNRVAQVGERSETVRVGCSDD